MRVNKYDLVRMEKLKMFILDLFNEINHTLPEKVRVILPDQGIEISDEIDVYPEYGRITIFCTSDSGIFGHSAPITVTKVIDSEEARMSMATKVAYILGSLAQAYHVALSDDVDAVYMSGDQIILDLDTFTI